MTHSRVNSGADLWTRPRSLRAVKSGGLSASRRLPAPQEMSKDLGPAGWLRERAEGLHVGWWLT